VVVVGERPSTAVVGNGGGVDRTSRSGVVVSNRSAIAAVVVVVITVDGVNKLNDDLEGETCLQLERWNKNDG